MESIGTVKDHPAGGPTLNQGAVLNAARNLFANSITPTVKTASAANTSTSREVVRSFLSALAPIQPEPPVLAKDLSRFSRVIRSVLQAADDNILTPAEADAVIRFMAECFANRRVEEVFSRVVSPKSGSWFILDSHAKDE